MCNGYISLGLPSLAPQVALSYICFQETSQSSINLNTSTLLKIHSISIVVTLWHLKLGDISGFNLLSYERGLKWPIIKSLTWKLRPCMWFEIMWHLTEVLSAQRSTELIYLIIYENVVWFSYSLLPKCKFHNLQQPRFNIDDATVKNVGVHGKSKSVGIRQPSFSPSTKLLQKHSRSLSVIDARKCSMQWIDMWPNVGEGSIDIEKSTLLQ